MSLPIAGFWNSVVVIQLAAFGAVAVFAWWLLETFSKSKPRAEQRLDEFRDPNSRKSDLLSDSKKPGAMAKVLGAAAPAFSKPMQPKTEEDVSKIRLKLNQAGFRSETSVTTYWSLKTMGLSAGFVLGGGALLFTHGYSLDTLMYTVLVAGIMFYLPEIILWIITRGRKDNIFYGLPDALDLMVVCVEAGLGLDQAMRKVSEEMKKSYRVIAEEFALCNMQLQMGRARNDVLHDLGTRTGVDDLKQLAAILIQADKFGSSVGQALRVQSDSMRTRRSQMAEEKAAKTAVKLIFPLVLFIFPAIFIVLVGPAAITMVNELFPSMGG
jgi:tight adherence protein C